MSVHVLLVLVQVCFASLAVVGRLALRDVPPLALVLTRVAGGCLIFWLLALRGGPVTLPRRLLPRLVLCALLGVVANQIFFVEGLARSTATNASVLGSTIPVFTTIFALVLGVEPLRPQRLLGIVIALGGALVLVGVDRFSLTDGHAVGNLLIVINSACYGLFLVLVRPLAKELRPMLLVSLIFTVALVPVALLGGGDFAELAPRLDARGVGLLAFLVAVPTVGAYGFNQLALRRAEPSLVAVYIYLQPILATLGAALLLDERPTARTFVAAALIFGGVAVSARRAPAA